ncbi:MAG: cytidylate kinase [Gammaproteobacteria bacterium]|nr:cytidylate kinase [Gammaproteobacteria bacterium]|tara:strand:+ start:25931 stop:26590 length:660 start_codon:yes stop_codon:yes gene_type:complete
MKKINVITIDGPSASGKGSLAKNIANQFGIDILDSGSLYRLYAYFTELKFDSVEIQNKISNEIKFELKDMSIDIKYKSKNISNEIRSEDIAKFASKLSTRSEVRQSLYSIQRNFYMQKGLVADGRDMGTVVFKDAKLKIFLTASIEERAKRRYLELQNRGQEVNMPDLMADIEQRDFKDRSRDLSPLFPADDAHIIDSSNMSAEEVFLCTKKLYEKEFY